jgi:ribosomal protein S18 acetylase RimI-like enzyme
MRKDEVVRLPSPLGRLELRPERDEDAPFRFTLFRESQPPEFEALQLDPAMHEQLLRHQFEGQTRGYRSLYPQARFDIVLLDGEAIGRIVVDRAPASVRIVDQAILREHRGRGIGSAIMRALMDEARGAGVPVTLNVMAGNAAALRLYLRLGFVPTETLPTHTAMEWRAPA